MAFFSLALACPEVLPGPPPNNCFFFFFACRELLVSLLRKSLDGFIGAHPNHSEKALESTQLYTKSGLSALFSPLLLDHQFILKTHTQPKTTLPEKLTNQQP